MLYLGDTSAAAAAAAAPGSASTMEIFFAKEFAHFWAIEAPGERSRDNDDSLLNILVL